MDAAMAALYARMDADPSAARMRAAKTLRITSRLDVMGMAGPSVTTIQPPDKIHSATSIHGIGETLQVDDGTHAWSRSPFEGLRELVGEELHVFRRSARLDAGAWREQFAKVEIVAERREGERDVIVLRQTPREGEGQPIVLTIDATTLLPWRTETTVRARMGPMQIATEIVEYATFDGIVMPKKSVAKVGAATLTTVTEKVELDVPIDAALFAKPAKLAGKPGNEAPREPPK